MRDRSCFGILIILLVATAPMRAQSAWDWLGGASHARDYRLRRISSYDRTGANADARPLDAGGTLTILNEKGPGSISHIWMTIGSPEPWYLKKLILRMYWDDETEPSVETPLGDFFGLGNGEYFQYQSLPLSVGASQALNCFFPMPFNRSAKITLTNEGAQKADAVYYNIDMESFDHPLSPDLLYFHAQYHQCAPCKGWTNDWPHNYIESVNNKVNLDGKDNYVILEAAGRGHYVGVTQSVLQNQNDWWGEGDDMIFIDGEKLPSINGTGAEDYYLGAWGFGGTSSYLLYGVPVMGGYTAGSRHSVYRFHLDAPVTFRQSIRVTLEHGHANHRSDNYYTVAYWYQAEPHAKFAPLPLVSERTPRLYATGGPGNATQ